FEYDLSASASLQFYRMCDEFDKTKREKRPPTISRTPSGLFSSSNIYGTDADDLTSWRTLCQIVHVFLIPGTSKSCRKAVKATHVNIVDTGSQ
ncbi:hypothetical protein DFH29DRAFT_806599, partial [Suillus ampliporus]